MLDKLLTERTNPASEDIDARSTAEILQIINREDRSVAEAVAKVIPEIARAVDLITERVRQGGRLFYIGAGTSGRLGVLDASECPPTFQVPAEMVQGVIAGGDAALRTSSEAVEDSPEAGGKDLLAAGFGALDVVVGIAASGRTPYVLGAVDTARGLGAATIGLSCNPESYLAGRVDVALTPVTGPEVIAGSTRMKAGTATKLVLNMLSTALMIRLGHVFGNLMVNVQPVNTKLAARARRIVAMGSGVPEAEAGALLDEAGGSVKVAIVMARYGVSKEDAERKLEQAGGRLSEVVRLWTSL